MIHFDVSRSDAARESALNFYGAENISSGAAAPRIFIQTSHGKPWFDSWSSRRGVEASIPSSGGTFTVILASWASTGRL